MGLSIVLIVAGVCWTGLVLFLTIFGLADFFIATNGNPNINPLSFVWYGLLAVVLGVTLLWYSTKLWRK